MTLPEPTLPLRRFRLPKTNGPRPGTASAALAHRDFRLLWLGSFASNIGVWMRTVVLGSYAYKLTGSSTFIGLLTFAQLAPLMLLSIPGGVLADVIDRRRWLVSLQVEQLVFSAVLALLVTGEPSRLALFVVVLAIGVGFSLNAPAWGATLPALVDREHLAGAIALNSTMINGSRVIGPATAGVLYPILGAAWIFAINAAAYLFIIVALLVVRLPPVVPAKERGWARVAAGVRAARANPVVGRILITLTLFSFFSLPFVGLFAAVAERGLGLDSESTAFGLLYAAFGLGACLGALSIGTLLASATKMNLVRSGLVGFAISLAVFAVVRHPAPAFPVVFVLGAFYFGSTTAMLTVLQSTLDDAVRGRVLALWFMAFGGTVPFGALVFGKVLDATNVTVVLGIGATAALLLAWWCNLRWVAKLSMTEVI